MIKLYSSIVICLAISACAHKPTRLMTNEAAAEYDKTPEGQFGECLRRVAHENWGPTAKTAFCVKRMEIDARSTQTLETSK